MSVDVENAAFYNRETGELQTVGEMREQAMDPSLAVEDQIDQLTIDVADLRKEIHAVRQDITRAVEIIERVGAEVMPTVNSLLESPAIRMFVGKKK